MYRSRRNTSPDLLFILITSSTPVVEVKLDLRANNMQERTALARLMALVAVVVYRNRSWANEVKDMLLAR